MSNGNSDSLTRLREHVASARARPGYHPYWATARVVVDEPLWAISFRPHSQEHGISPYRTATSDLDQAIGEARAHLQARKRAAISVLPTVPRSDTYRKAKDMLIGMLTAVPAGHPAAGAMLDELQTALRIVSDAEREGRYFGGLTVSLPIALEVDELRAGRPQAVRTVGWMEHDGDWPEWNRCTV